MTRASRRPARADRAGLCQRLEPAGACLRDPAGRRARNRDAYAGTGDLPAGLHDAPAASLSSRTCRPAARPGISPPRARVGLASAGSACTVRPTTRSWTDRIPYIAVDMARCIDCYRCVRICDEVQGIGSGTCGTAARDTRIEPDGPTLRESSCVSCGACVDTCPTGALEDATRARARPAVAWTRTTCPYCGVGCELDVGTRDGRIVSVRPVLDAPVSKGHLCVKGRYAFEFVDAADRVTEPMIRDGRRLAARLLGRGACVRRRAAARARSTATARTASACSARRARRTKRTTSRRSSPASSSAPTTSTAARASATRRAPRR